MWSVAPTAATDRAAGRTVCAPGSLQAVSAAKFAAPAQPVQGVQKKFQPPAAAPRPGVAAGVTGAAGAKGLGQRPAGCVGGPSKPALLAAARPQQLCSRSPDRGAGHGECNEVAAFLKELGLPQYTEALLANGFDEMDTLLLIEDSDMKEIGMDACHVVKLRRRLHELRQGAGGPELDDGNPVVAFLKEIGLDQYAEALLQSGFDELATLADIEDDDMRDLGIPRGHAVKLRRCLREHQAPQESAPQPAPVRAHRAPAARRPAPTSRAVLEQSMPDDQMKSAVERSWERVQAIGSNVVGEMLYRHTFALDPAVMVLFPVSVRAKYRDWTADEGSDESNMYESAALRKLFSKFVNAIGCTVAGLHDFGRLVPMLTQLGSRHAGYGLNEGHWPTLGKALIFTLRECLGGELTSEVEAAWTMVYGFMSNIMIQGLRAALADASHGGATGALRSLEDGDSQSGDSTCLPSEGDGAGRDWTRQGSGTDEGGPEEDVSLQDPKKEPDSEASAAA